MKKIIRISLALTIIMILNNMISPPDLIAQPSPPSHRKSGNQSGVQNTPVGSGLLWMLSLGAGYGLIKYTRGRKNSRNSGKTPPFPSHRNP